MTKSKCEDNCAIDECYNGNLCVGNDNFPSCS